MVGRTSGLVDRAIEREAVDRLIADVRDGRSRVLVIRGDAGVGKTARLEYLQQSTSGFQVAKATGVESERELPYAGVHQLCEAMLGRIDGLPGPQRDALATPRARTYVSTRLAIRPAMREARAAELLAAIHSAARTRPRRPSRHGCNAPLNAATRPIARA
jgi:AAA ATPase domain